MVRSIIGGCWARGNQYAIAAQAASRDGNIRVGLKDSLWIWSDALRRRISGRSSARPIFEGLGLEIASPDDARQMLHLKGGDRVEC